MALQLCPCIRTNRQQCVLLTSSLGNISKAVPSHVSGVILQLAKLTGPPSTKNFPLLRLFLSDAIMARKINTPYDDNCTNLDILTSRRMSHWPTSKPEKKFVRACPKPKLENYESEDDRLKYFRIKK